MGIEEEVFIFGVVMVVCLIDFGVLLYIGIASLFIILIFVLLGCLSFGGIHMNKLGLFVIRSWVIAEACFFWVANVCNPFIISFYIAHVRYIYGTHTAHPLSIPQVSLKYLWRKASCESKLVLLIGENAVGFDFLFIKDIVGDGLVLFLVDSL